MSGRPDFMKFATTMVRTDAAGRHFRINSLGKPVYLDGQPAICMWFLLCDHEATKTRQHPILADVPICDRCDQKI